LPVALVLLYLSTPEPPLRETHTTRFWRGVRVAATNWPFVRLFAATALVRMGSRAVEGLLIFYLVSVAMFSQKEASSSILALLIPAVICAPLWIWAGNHYTKHRALCAAMAGGIVVFAMLPLISGLGYTANIVAFAVLGAMFSAPFTLGQSMAADVIDLDSLKSHEPRAGLLISFFQFANKGGDALGIFLSLQLVALLGFTAEKCATNVPGAIHGLEAVYVLFPVATWVPAILLLWNFPITPDIQRRMRVLIDKRIKIENSGRLRKLNGKT
jgi:Na+/melibiose symporter-like transporter